MSGDKWLATIFVLGHRFDCGYSRGRTYGSPLHLFLDIGLIPINILTLWECALLKFFFIGCIQLMIEAITSSLVEPGLLRKR